MSAGRQWPAVAWVVALGVAVGALYVPLLLWLERLSVRLDQLSTGAVLVLAAAGFGLRDAWREARPAPRISSHGLALLAAGFIMLGLAGYFPRWALPLTLLSFCLSVAGLASFLFGRLGVAWLVPALAAFFVFGMLAGLFPHLDWPLRMLAGRCAAGLLDPLGVPVKLALWTGKPPELLIETGGRLFIVATECNGFGLLTSSLLLATILAFQYRLPWLAKAAVVGVAVPLAIVGNFLRIVVICLIAPRVALPYLFVHEAIGLVFYLLGLWLVYRVARYAMGPTEPRQV